MVLPDGVPEDLTVLLFESGHGAVVAVVPRYCQSDHLGAAAKRLLGGDRSGARRHQQPHRRRAPRGRATLHRPAHRDARTRTLPRLVVTSILSGGIRESGRPYVTRYRDVTSAVTVSKACGIV